MSHQVSALGQLQVALDDFRRGQLPLNRFVQQHRQPDAGLVSALPPAFGEVWVQLMDRLESSALFSEESCSFSQRDLIDSLQLWLDKARQRLAGSVGTLA